VNVPLTEKGDPDGDRLPEVVVCPMNTHGLNDRYERRTSPRGDVYYWSANSGLDFHGTDDDSDVHRLLERKVTVTPLLYDLTDAADLPRWRAALAASRTR
jgi:5'-nucleotidase